MECFLEAMFSMLCVLWVILMPTSGINCQPLLQMQELRQRISYLTPSAQLISARHSTEALDHLCSGLRPSSGKEGCSKAGVARSQGTWPPMGTMPASAKQPGLTSVTASFVPLGCVFYLWWRLRKARLNHFPRVPPWGRQLRSRGARRTALLFLVEPTAVLPFLQQGFSQTRERNSQECSWFTASTCSDTDVISCRLRLDQHH